MNSIFKKYLSVSGVQNIRAFESEFFNGSTFSNDKILAYQGDNKEAI